MKIERGQVAVVTGAASGIGYGLAQALAARGMSVVLSDLRPEPLQHATAALEQGGATTLAVAADVSDPAAVEALAAATLERFGRVDLVCNNAGVVCRQAPMWEQDVATWHWLLDVMLMGVVHGIRAFVPHLVEQQSGHVLNTASLGGLVPLPGLGPYSAAKHAVVGITETLAVELAEAAPGVGATVLCPGLVETALGTNSQSRRPGEAADLSVRNPQDSPGGGKVLKPAAVAALAIAAIEANRLHVLTHADTEAAVRGRVAAVLANLPAAV
jgi:NAD(P)-dependent dehydrogenase (short-subunit alcohol dehydrogenase family)